LYLTPLNGNFIIAIVCKWWWSVGIADTIRYQKFSEKPKRVLQKPHEKKPDPTHECTSHKNTFGQQRIAAVLSFLCYRTIVDSGVSRWG
jgi:cytochrome b